MTTLLAIGYQSTEFRNSRNEDIAITVKGWKSYSFGIKKFHKGINELLMLYSNYEHFFVRSQILLWFCDMIAYPDVINFR